jgi:hypothetical protein
MAVGDTTPGRHCDVQLHKMEPGDYGFAVYGPEDEGVWMCRAPNGYGGNLANHTISEHEDGTITVSPSILIQRPPEGEWHGYLERGVWREV